MRIFIIKSLFCPNDIYYEATTNSIVKINIFFNLLQSQTKMNSLTPIDADILYIGWINTYSEKFDTFISLLNSSFSSIYKELWALNYGKYRIYNYIIKFCKDNPDKYEYIIYLDHDIYFDIKTLNMYQFLYKLKDYRINDKKLGLIAFNQLIDNRHRTDIDNNKKIILFESQLFGSIASGAFILFMNVINDMDYFDMLSVYGLDDYHLTKKLSDMGYANVVIGNVHVMHPFDNNKSYVIWKKNQVLKLIKNKSSNYFQQIQQSINFWKDNDFEKNKYQ
jgi:hypothetical protein